MAKNILMLSFVLILPLLFACNQEPSSPVYSGNVGHNEVSNGVSSKSGMKKVVVITPMSHPALNRAIDGFKAALAEGGFAADSTGLEVLNANGDFSKIAYLTKKAVKVKPDVIFVLTTPAGSTAITITNPERIPLVYTAITDPVEAGIVSDMSYSKTYATGVSDKYPVKEQVAFFKRIYPGMGKLGVIYSSGEENSRILSKMTIKYAKEEGVEAKEYVVTDPGKISYIVKKSLAENDAIVINGDNQLVENLESVVKLSIINKKPLFVGDTDSVRRGGVATVGPSYYTLGFSAGKKAVKILNGVDVRTIPSEDPADFDYIVNFEAAKAMGLDIPLSALSIRRIWEARAFTNQ